MKSTQSKHQIPLLNRLYNWFGQRKTTAIIFGIFLIHASWLAFSAAFPGAFDEEYHLGLIGFYSHRLSPWLAHQPANMDWFGAMYRDPSYLYHYLMSWVWRLVTWITTDWQSQIVAMRMVNVFLVMIGLWIWWRFLRRINLSAQLANVIILVVALVPLFPLLAAQVNYDSGIFIVTGLALLLAYQFVAINRC